MDQIIANCLSKASEIGSTFLKVIVRRPVSGRVRRVAAAVSLELPVSEIVRFVATRVLEDDQHLGVQSDPETWTWIADPFEGLPEEEARP